MIREEILASRVQKAYAISLVITLSAVTFAYSNFGENFLIRAKLDWLILMVGLCTILCAIAGLVMFRDRAEHSFRWTTVDSLVLAWLTYVGASSFFLGGSTNNDKLLLLFACVCTYFSLRTVFQSGKSSGGRLYVLGGVILISIIQSAFGLLQFFHLIPSLNPLFDLTGTFYNPAPLALFLAACYPVSLIVALFRSNGRLKSAGIVSVVFILIVLPITGNRASCIAALLITGAVLSYRYNLLFRVRHLLRLSRARRIVLSVLGLALVAIACYITYRIKPVSADGRLLIWEITANKLSSNPLFGQGYGSFKENYSKWQIDYFQSNPSVLDKSYIANSKVSEYAGYVVMAFNEYLEIAVEQGICGLLLFLMVATCAISRSIIALRKEFSPIRLAGLLGFLSILIVALFSYPLYSLPTLLLFFLYLFFASEEGGQQTPALPKHNYASKALCLTWLFSSLFIGGFFVRYAAAKIGRYGDYRNARILDKGGQTGEAEYGYQQLYPYLRNDGEFLLDYSICLIGNDKLPLAFSYLQQAEKESGNPKIYLIEANILKEWKRYKEAEGFYKKAILVTPSLLYPKYLLVKLYVETKDFSKALRMANVIINQKVKVENDLALRIMGEMKELIRTHPGPGGR